MKKHYPYQLTLAIKPSKIGLKDASDGVQIYGGTDSLLMLYQLFDMFSIDAIFQNVNNNNNNSWLKTSLSGLYNQ